MLILYSYQTSYYNSSSSAIQAGISYSLPDGRNISLQKKEKIEILMFYEHNTTGIFDEGDLSTELVEKPSHTNSETATVRPIH
jgi:hypothetical protein